MSWHDDPNEPAPRTATFRKDGKEEEFLAALNELLREADIRAPRVDAEGASSLPLVYIVGGPRSGSTLFYQALSRYLPVAYINNLIARFWLRPSVGIALSRALLGPDCGEDIRFRSRYGVAPAVSGPHEFGYFWRYWLHLDRTRSHHLSEAEWASVDVEGLKLALESELLASFGAPLVFKCAFNGFHAARLTGLHPHSLFIFLKRDPIAVARSVLRARKERYGSYDTWWSVKPSTYDEIRNLPDAGLQVARQIADCWAETEAALAKEGVHAIEVHYEEFCANPTRILGRVCAALAGMGCSISPRTEAIEPFLISSGHSLPRELEESVQSNIRSLLGESVRAAWSGQS